MKDLLKKVTVIVILGVTFVGLSSVINLKFKVVQQYNIAVDIDPGPANFT